MSGESIRIVGMTVIAIGARKKQSVLYAKEDGSQKLGSYGTCVVNPGSPPTQKGKVPVKLAPTAASSPQSAARWGGRQLWRCPINFAHRHSSQSENRLLIVTVFTHQVL